MDNRNYEDKEIIDTLNALGEMFHDNAVKHGFWPFSKEHEEKCSNIIHPINANQIDVNLRNKGELIALMHSELSECLEGIRKPHQDEHCQEFTSEEVELADAMIRIMEYGTAYKLRLAEAILAKHKYNVSRPFKHGKAF